MKNKNSMVSHDHKIKWQNYVIKVKINNFNCTKLWEIIDLKAIMRQEVFFIMVWQLFTEIMFSEKITEQLNKKK